MVRAGARWLLAVAVIGLGGAARADGLGEARKEASLPRARIEVGYALSFRDDRQSVAAVDVSAKGLAPSRLEADLGVFFGDLPLGAAASFGWERFALTGSDLLDRQVELTAIGIDAGGGLALRADLAGWALEGQVGYGFHRLPIVDSRAVALRSGSVKEHGPMLAVRFGRPSGSWFLPEVRAAAIPYAFATTPTGSSHGWALDAGAGVGVGLPLAGLEWAAVLGYDLAVSRVGAGGGLQYRQMAHRVSLGLRLTLPGPARVVEPRRPTGPGRIRGLLLDADGKPVSGHVVEVVGQAPVTTDRSGAFVVARAGPGEVVVRAAMTGLRPAQEAVQVPPGAEASVELRLTRPTGPGTIRGVVYDKPADRSRRARVPGAQIRVGGEAGALVTADANGAFVVEKAGPGLVPLEVSAKGYVAGEEVVSVPAEGEATVELAIAAEEVKVPATLRGLVRTVAGRPLKATLTVPEARLKATTNASGEFSLNVPGGRYRVRIEARGYRAQVKTVEVADGDQAIFNIDMHPAK